MAWKHLNAELGILFKDLTQRDHEIREALEVRNAEERRIASERTSAYYRANPEYRRRTAERAVAARLLRQGETGPQKSGRKPYVWTDTARAKVMDLLRKQWTVPAISKKLEIPLRPLRQFRAEWIANPKGFP